MKKLLALSAVSMAAFLSACSSDHMNHANGQCPNMHRGDHMEHAQMMNDYYFERMDANGDGAISMKEFMTYQKNMFRMADTNHDGKLTPEELKAYMVKQRGMMKEWMHTQHGDHSEYNRGPDGEVPQPTNYYQQ